MGSLIAYDLFGSFVTEPARDCRSLWGASRGLSHVTKNQVLPRSPRTPPSQRDPFRLFRTGGVRPPTEVMVDFIDDYREEYRVEPICSVLPIAPSTDHERKARQADPTRLPARLVRDA